jgi:lysozyme
MLLSQRGAKLIQAFEGLHLRAYQDSVGVWTIGWGHTKDVHQGQVITRARAEELFREDVLTFERAVASCVKVAITQQQFDALVSFAFNLGVGALRKSTLLKMLNNQDYQGAAQQFGRWTRAGKVELAGLVKRRAAERKLFEEMA